MLEFTSQVAAGAPLACRPLDGIEAGGLESIADQDTAQTKAALSADPAITDAAQLTTASGR
jgi:hypothetical protein